MLKRVFSATLLVFLSWQALDFVIHGLILMSTYEATSQLWRPMEEMNNGLMIVVSLIAAFTFTWIFARYFGRKTLKTGLGYGFWFGVGAGLSMGFGSYSVMPLPFHMALTWFLSTVVQGLVAGMIVGLVLKDRQVSAEAAA